jgi:hypothetical protein
MCDSPQPIVVLAVSDGERQRLEVGHLTPHALDLRREARDDRFRAAAGDVESRRIVDGVGQHCLYVPKSREEHHVAAVEDRCLLPKSIPDRERVFEALALEQCRDFLRERSDFQHEVGSRESAFQPIRRPEAATLTPGAFDGQDVSGWWHFDWYLPRRA